MRALFIGFIAAALLPVMVQASQKTLDLGEVIVQQQQIKAEVVAANGPYADFPARKREELLRKQDSLLRMLDGKQSADELTESQRRQAFNTLEWIEATINQAEDERMVCTRERRVGSNRITSVCRTQAEAEKAREAARETMLGRGACTDLGGPGCTGN